MTVKAPQRNKESIKRVPFFFSIDTSKLTFAEDGKSQLQVLMCGKWNHPFYGPIILTPVEMAEFKKNFDSGLRRDIPITEGHESFDEKPAVGWFKELEDRGQDGLWATIEWTEQGKTLLQEKSYKYFSPEFYTEYEDPETREIYKNVLVGGALTNKPYFKRMSAVTLSETSINKNYHFNENNNMDLATILAKKVEELTPEEKAFVKENKEQLTTEQLATFGSVIEDAPAELTAEQKAANVAAGLNEDGSAKTDAPAELTQEQKDANVAAGKNEDGTEKVEASDKNFVKMSAAEHKALTDMANKGAKAFAELRESKIKTEVSKLVFSEQNSKGKILPKDEAKVFSFALGLTDAQRKTFAEIVAEIPSSKLFNEVGSGSGVVEGTAAAELDTKVKAKMSEDSKLKYADAVRLVLASDKDLAKRYTEETTPGKN